jgi:hypothetical protein
MSKPVAYRFKSPLSEEGQWEYGKEPPVGSRWEIEGLYRVQVNLPRTPLEKAAKDVLHLVEYMLRNGEWYQAQERADALRAALGMESKINHDRAALEQPEWQGLTDEEALAILVGVDPETKRLSRGFRAFARAIEAKLKERNT